MLHLTRIATPLLVVVSAVALAACQGEEPSDDLTPPGAELSFGETSRSLMRLRRDLELYQAKVTGFRGPVIPTRGSGRPAQPGAYTRFCSGFGERSD